MAGRVAVCAKCWRTERSRSRKGLHKKFQIQVGGDLSNFKKSRLLEGFFVPDARQAEEIAKAEKEAREAEAELKELEAAEAKEASAAGAPAPPVPGPSGPTKSESMSAEDAEIAKAEKEAREAEEELAKLEAQARSSSSPSFSDHVVIYWRTSITTDTLSAVWRLFFSHELAMADDTNHIASMVCVQRRIVWL